MATASLAAYSTSTGCDKKGGILVVFGGGIWGRQIDQKPPAHKPSAKASGLAESIGRP